MDDHYFTKAMFQQLEPDALRLSHYFERCVLCAILKNPGHAFPKVNEVLKQDINHFEDRRNRDIYEWMLATDVIDIAIMYKDLHHRMGDGFATYLAGDILDAAPTSCNAEFYSKEVLNNSRLRYIHTAALRVKAGEISYKEAAEGEKYYTYEAEDTIVSGRQLSEITRDHLMNIAAMEGRPQGIPTGMEILNSRVHGWRYGKYILLGARTSVGKTAFAINAVVAASQGGYPTLMFSCEMDMTDIGERVFGILGDVDVEQVRRGWNLAQQKAKIDAAADALARLPKIHIDDDQKLSITKIKDRARRFVKQNGNTLIVVDYLQRVRPDGKKADKRNEVASISAELQTLAKELQSPILCLAQVNRQGLNQQNSGAETTATIQESDSPAQDADCCIFLMKPEGKTLESIIREKNITADADKLLQIIISKNRMGPTGQTVCIFDKWNQTFRPIQSEPWRKVDQMTPKITQEEIDWQNEETPFD